MSDKEKQGEPEFFVSRRGRQVGIHEVDLKGIDIDSDKETAPSRNDPPKQAGKKPDRVNTPRKTSRKKKWTILLVVVLLLALPLAVAELVTAQYRSGVTNAKTDLATVVLRDVLPLQKKTSVTADQLRGVAGNVNGIVGKMCRGGMLDNAAQLYPRAKAAFEDCKEAQRGYAGLTSQLYNLENQARYLEKLGTILKSVTTPITDEYAVIGAQQTAWRAAADDIKTVTPPESMKSAHSDLVNHVGAIADGWSKLNTANNSQDATAFTDAEKTLSNEYEAVRGSSAQLLSVLSDTQAKLTAAYNTVK